MDYTVIGDTVNLGARLCSSAKPGEILVSLNVHSITKETSIIKSLSQYGLKEKKKSSFIQGCLLEGDTQSKLTGVK